MGGTRLERAGDSPGKMPDSEVCGAESGAVSTFNTLEPALMRLICQWPKLLPSTKRTIQILASQDGEVMEP